MSDGFICGRDAGPRPVLDRLDGRVRIAAALAVVTTVVMLRSSVVLAALVPVVVGLAVLSGTSLRELAGRLAHVEGFLIVTAVVLPMTVPGPQAAAFGPLSVSWPGIERATAMLLRVNLCAVAVLTLLAGLEPVRFGHALARLGMPAKLVHLLLFAARYVTVIRAEAQRLNDAARARAFRARTSLHTLRTFAHFTGQLLVRSLARAERVDEAMRCRAFAGRFALVGDDAPTGRDAIFATALALALVLVLLVDRAT